MNSNHTNRTTIRHTGRTTRKLIAGIALAAGLAGLGAGAAGAQTTQPAAVTSSAQHGPGRGHRGGPGAMHAEVLGSLVKAGTITQAKADAIVKAFEAARPAKPAEGSTATPPANRPDPAAAHKAVLDSLVKAGTITQGDADAVQKAFEAARPQGTPGGMPQGPDGQHGPGRGHRGGPGAMHAEVLGSLVKAGTITQAKADAIVKAFEAARPAKPAEGSTATPPANRPDPAAAHKAVLDSLVKAGTITQGEADAVQKAFEAARPQGMPPVRGARGAVSSTHAS